jgi:hypothetical protein
MMQVGVLLTEPLSGHAVERVAVFVEFGEGVQESFPQRIDFSDHVPQD